MLGCHKPVIPMVTFLTPLASNSKGLKYRQGLHSQTTCQNLPPNQGCRLCGTIAISITITIIQFSFFQGTVTEIYPHIALIPPRAPLGARRRGGWDAIGHHFQDLKARTCGGGSKRRAVHKEQESRRIQTIVHLLV